MFLTAELYYMDLSLWKEGLKHYQAKVVRYPK